METRRFPVTKRKTFERERSSRNDRSERQVYISVGKRVRKKKEEEGGKNNKRAALTWFD